jgi:hypothetical protein
MSVFGHIKSLYTLNADIKVRATKKHIQAYPNPQKPRKNKPKIAHPTYKTKEKKKNPNQHPQKTNCSTHNQKSPPNLRATSNLNVAHSEKPRVPRALLKEIRTQLFQRVLLRQESRHIIKNLFSLRFMCEGILRT